MVYRLDTIWFPSCAVAAPPLCGICAALGFFMVSWEGVIYVSTRDLSTSRFM